MVIKLNSELTTPGSPVAENDLSSSELVNFIQTKIWTRPYGSGNSYHIFFQYPDFEDTNDVTLPDSTVANPQDLYEAYQAQLPNPGELLALLRVASNADIIEIKAILGVG